MSDTWKRVTRKECGNRKIFSHWWFDIFTVLNFETIFYLLARGFWESWRGIMIVHVVRRRRSFVVRSFVRSFIVRWCNAFSGPPMISLNGWRYEILVKTKKIRLDVKMCNREENFEKSHFCWPVASFLAEN